MKFIEAPWSCEGRLRALTTTRLGGCSLAPFESLNLGDHVADDARAVAENRERLLSSLGLKKQPQWLQQVHGTEVVKACADGQIRTADACWSDEPGLACVVMTADCLPVFFANNSANKVAVAHAGWRGLADGVLENTLAIFDDPSQVKVWLGPAIGPSAFEVGEDVHQRFCDLDAAADAAFLATPDKNGKYLANIYQLADLRLRNAGVELIDSCDLCTYKDAQNFFSYRRNGQTGRMASLIWIDEDRDKG